MSQQRYVAYFRVSTQKQGTSGLGLDAQRRAVCEFLKQYGGELVADFTEVESGKRTDRPEFIKAADYAELSNSILLVAKLELGLGGQPGRGATLAALPGLTHTTSQFARIRLLVTQDFAQCHRQDLLLGIPHASSPPSRSPPTAWPSLPSMHSRSFRRTRTRIE